MRAKHGENEFASPTLRLLPYRFRDCRRAPDPIAATTRESQRSSAEAA
jgi:hypothetical protein